MIDRYQLAAARGMLGWTLKELSAKTNITIEAIHKFETGAIETPRKSTLTALQDVFENNGIEFIEQSGVRRRSGIVRVYEGFSGIEKFYNQIAALAEAGGSDFLHFGLRYDDISNFHIEPAFSAYRQRMQNLDRPVFRSICSEREKGMTKTSYASYRYWPDEKFIGVPFYVFGDNLAIISARGASSQAVVLFDNNMCQEYRRHFDLMWELASV